jgi:hypothetical protein
VLHYLSNSVFSLSFKFCSLGWWLVLICSERKVLLVVGSWFVLREKFCWLVADKPSEHGVDFLGHGLFFCIKSGVKI